MARIKSLSLLWMTIILSEATVNGSTDYIKLKVKDDSKIPNIKLSDKSTKQLYKKWGEQAVGSLMAAIASQINLPPLQAEKLNHCYENSDGVVGYASCLGHGLKTEKVMKHFYPLHPKKTMDPKHARQWGGTPRQLEPIAQQTTSARTTKEYSSGIRNLMEDDDELFRGGMSNTDLEININKALETIRGATGTHIGSRSLPRSYLKSLRKLERIRAAKKRLGIRKKRMTVEDALKKHLAARQRMKDTFNTVKTGNYFPSKSSGAIVADFLTETVRKIKLGDAYKRQRAKTWRQSYGLIRKRVQIERKMREQQEKIRTTMKKMVDTVPVELDELNPRRPLAASFVDFDYDEVGKNYTEPPQKVLPGSADDDETRSYFEDPLWPINLMRDIYYVAKNLNGRNNTNENATFRVLSPKFLNLFHMKESVNEAEDENVLSPSVFSFHDEGLAPLPKILKHLTENERNAWIDFIIEASGASDAMEDLSKAIGSDRALAGLPKEIFSKALTRENATDIFGDVVNTVMDMWQKLYSTYSEKQVQDLNTKGYSFFTKEQMDTMYGPNGIASGTQVDFDIDALNKLEDHEKEAVLHDYIEKIGKSEGFDVRMKDAVVGIPIVLEKPISLIKNPSVLTPLTLSPLVLSPVILSPVALGPITLSPWVLNPIILSPKVLSALILSPTVGSPFILSPVVLNPVILSPGVMDPFILNPFVLTPLILSPEVMNPKILSPFVLSPAILSPGVMNPLILSPFALSPLILSSQDLFAMILSPSAYSPVIKSKLKRSKIVLSPTLFS